VTPTHAPDIDLFHDLHRSVLENTPETVIHHVVTPTAHHGLFAQFGGPRCVVLTEEDVLPRHVVPVPWATPLLRRVVPSRPWVSIAAINLRRPVPPVRGWVLQQVVKLAISAQIDADVLLLLDSDVQLVRPVTAETFLRNGSVRFYRNDQAVHDGMVDHLAWHRLSRHLLGLPPAVAPLPDYVSSFTVWEPRLVRSLLDRITIVAGRPWVDVLCGQMRLSEWTLYGVFVDHFGDPAATEFASNTTLCHSYWDTTPLDGPAAARFVDDFGTEEVAVLIQSKSRTPIGVRRAALAAIGMRTSGDVRETRQVP